MARSGGRFTRMSFYHLDEWTGTASELLSLLTHRVSQENRDVSPLAEIARMADQRAPPCRPPTPHAWYIRYFREKPRRTNNLVQIHEL
jgi:hypothetical protein